MLINNFKLDIIKLFPSSQKLFLDNPNSLSKRVAQASSKLFGKYLGPQNLVTRKFKSIAATAINKVQNASNKTKEFVTKNRSSIIKAALIGSTVIFVIAISYHTVPFVNTWLSNSAKETKDFATSKASESAKSFVEKTVNKASFISTNPASIEPICSNAKKYPFNTSYNPFRTIVSEGAPLNTESYKNYENYDEVLELQLKKAQDLLNIVLVASGFSIPISLAISTFKTSVLDVSVVPRCMPRRNSKFRSNDNFVKTMIELTDRANQSLEKLIDFSDGKIESDNWEVQPMTADKDFLNEVERSVLNISAGLSEVTASAKIEPLQEGGLCLC